jgi:hypothetical protein
VYDLVTWFVEYQGEKWKRRYWPIDTLAFSVGIESIEFRLNTFRFAGAAMMRIEAARRIFPRGSHY